jgi:4-amino-4-deoxy-L-arabinose transferase-like glycosyltransferase
MTLMLATLLAALLVLFFGVALVATFRLRSIFAYLIGVFLLAYANVVLSIEIASIFGLITPAFVMVTHLVLAGIAWLVWRKAGRPALLGPLQGRLLFWKGLPPFRKRALVYLMAGAVGAVYLVGAILILTTPQNNFDSMTYHLSRVGYWLQHQTLYPWETPDPRQTDFPMNAEIGVLWTVLFWGTDQLSGFVQWLGAWAAALAVYGLARLMGARRWQGAMAGLLFLSFPEILLQSMTTMNDLITAAFLSSGVVNLFLGWREDRRPYLWLSALGFALAAGTKTTVALMAPGLLILLALLVWFVPRNPRAKLVNLLAAGVLSFVLVGAMSFIQNAHYRGSPAPLPQVVSGVLGNPKPRGQMLVEGLSLHAIQAADLSGIPPGIQRPLARLKSEALQSLMVGFPATEGPEWNHWRYAIDQVSRIVPVADEDLAWFGPLFLILFIPAMVYQFTLGIRARDPLRLGLLIVVVGFSVSLNLLFTWRPFQGRYYTLVMPFSAALIYPWFSDKRSQAWFSWVIVAVSLAVSCTTILYNRSKPLVGPAAIWGKQALEIRLYNNRGFEPVIAAVEEFVPADGNLATSLGSNSWDYLLFGRRFQRTILPLDPDSRNIDPQSLRDQEVDYLLVGPLGRRFLSVPEGLDLVWLEDGWSLYQPCDAPPCEPGDQDAEALLSARDDTGLISVSPGLRGKVGILQLATGSWGIEQVDGGSIYWLGEGSDHNIRSRVWSDAEREVTISIDVVPGPGRTDSERIIQFRLLPRDGYEFVKEHSVMDERSFSSGTTLEFTVELQPGLNEIWFFSGDFAEIREQPNGDTRPLLILVKGIRIEE